MLLLPYLDQHTLWRLFDRSTVYVSLSSHDGTPNTFLEALACGCLPVVGDIASLREWLTDGENGLLVNPRDEHAAANAIVRALSDNKLKNQSQARNKSILAERAEQGKVRQAVQRFYEQIL